MDDIGHQDADDMEERFASKQDHKHQRVGVFVHFFLLWLELVVLETDIGLALANFPSVGLRENLLGRNTERAGAPWCLSCLFLHLTFDMCRL
jgi:hypothetical protein